MSKTYTTIELGGQERGLKFNMGTLKHLGEITRSDALTFQIQGNDLPSIYKHTQSIIHAALLSNCDSKKESPDFTAIDIEQWVNELDFSEAIRILNAFSTAYTIEVPAGEVSKNGTPFHVPEPY